MSIRADEAQLKEMNEDEQKFVKVLKRVTI